MEPYAWSCSSNTITFGLNHEFMVNSEMIRNGSASSSPLVLDTEKSQLVEARLKSDRKGAVAERTVAALRSHCQAERRRRARINSHLNTLRSLVPSAMKVNYLNILHLILIATSTFNLYMIMLL
jgi:hypothetical protein